MRFDIITLFPEMFRSVIGCSIMRRALEKGLIEVFFHNPRDFATDKHRVVDEYPYGGGGGMLLKVEPFWRAIESVPGRPYRILLSPQGRVFNQNLAKELSKKSHLLLICGHYEGIDERITELVDEEISIGDYVLTGGEIPAMVIMDAVSRLIPGVLGCEDSPKRDSFYDGLLDFPHYTKPREFKGLKVPEVLLSGDHGEVERWRRKEALQRTFKRRPELIEKISLRKYMEKGVYVGLVHYPVYNQHREIITTTVANLDIHDISRCCRTYGVKRFFIITPVQAQREIVKRIVEHWTRGVGALLNPDRREALERVKPAPSIEETVRRIEEREKSKPMVVSTSAMASSRVISFHDLKWKLLLEERPLLLLFGTGWGLAEEVKSWSDYVLEPIEWKSDYNHLSVRSAVSIVLDRLFKSV